MEQQKTKDLKKNNKQEKTYRSMNEIRKQFFPEFLEKEDERELSDVLIKESLEILKKHLSVK